MGPVRRRRQRKQEAEGPEKVAKARGLKQACRHAAGGHLPDLCSSALLCFAVNNRSSNRNAGPRSTRAERREHALRTHPP